MTSAFTPTYYDVLGIPRTADQKAIRQAYLRASLASHPDKNPGNEEESKAKFIEVGEAYNTLKDATSRAQYDREIATGAYRARRRQQRAHEGSTSKDCVQMNREFDNFMDMFDSTMAGMSEQELNIAMGAAAFVGSVVGSIIGSRAAKGNSFLSPAACMVGSAMASQAASTLVKSLHEDSTQRVIEKDERDAAIARGESVPEHTAGEGKERILKDAIGLFQKVAAAACSGVCSGNGGSVNIQFGRRGNANSAESSTKTGGGNDGSTRISWSQTAKFATMAAGAAAEMKRANAHQQQQQNARSR